MEQQETKQNNGNKKTLIICGSAVLVAAIALVCVLILGGGNSDNMSFMDGEMTFEAFCFGIKEDVPQETMDEVKRLYEQAKQAMKDGDQAKLNKVYEDLDELNIFDYSNLDTGFETTDGTAFSDESGNPIDIDDIEIINNVED